MEDLEQHYEIRNINDMLKKYLEYIEHLPNKEEIRGEIKKIMDEESKHTDRIYSR